MRIAAALSMWSLILKRSICRTFAVVEGVDKFALSVQHRSKRVSLQRYGDQSRTH